MVPDLRSLLQPPAISSRPGLGINDHTHEQLEGFKPLLNPDVHRDKRQKIIGEGLGQILGVLTLYWAAGFYFGAFTGYDPPSVNLKPISHFNKLQKTFKNNNKQLLRKLQNNGGSGSYRDRS